jgi:ribose 5-phosphate isomerase B
MKIAIGSDEVAVELKAAIQSFLNHQHVVPVEVADYRASGPQPVDAPDVALLVAEAVAAGEADRGILLCGSGVGMAITANKVPGVRAAQCHDVYTAQHARNSNDAQILVMGSRVVGAELATQIVAAWLKEDFESNPRRVAKMAKIDAIEKRYLAKNPGEKANR